MFEKLTIQQFCALDYNRNMVVTSGPGAGKTNILSHRYCFILLTDSSVSIPQILTLTFTEKAAEEMKTRIYQMLQELTKDLEGRGGHSFFDKIRLVKENFNRNRISTIHSFCAGLLKEYPVEAGIDPGFNIIQGVRQKEVILESIERTVSSIWKNEKETLMPLLHSFGSRRSLISAIMDLIEHPVTFQRVLSTSANLFKREKWIDSVFMDYCASIKEDAVIPYFQGLKEMGEGKGHYNELLNIFHNWEKEKNQKDKYFGIPGLFEKIRALVETREHRSPLLNVNYGRDTISYTGLVDEYFPDIFAVDNPDVVFQNELRLFLNVSEKCLTTYRKKKEKLNSMDFNDLETQAFLFLRGLYSNNNRESLLRIQNSFRYIMVDEFQDTNRIQWDIIRLLCLENEKGSAERLEEGKLFVVGDKRQAIYRFRGGDVTVFDAVTKEIQESNGAGRTPMFFKKEKIRKVISETFHVSEEFLNEQDNKFESLPHEEKDNILKGNIYLPHNFRSDSRPISFFNRAFKEIFGNKGATEIRDYETIPGLIALPDHIKGRPENQGSVTFYLSGPESGRNSQVESEAALIADIIEGILGRHGKERYEYKAYSDIREKIRNNRLSIGILFFTFTHLKAYENVFRDMQIPFSVHRGRGFYRCQEIMDILQLLNYIADKRQIISLLSVLRSPVFGVTDPEVFDIFYGNNRTISRQLFFDTPYTKKINEQINCWRSLSTRLTIPELIRAIIFDRSLTAIYSVHPNGVQKLANIEKLIEIARHFQIEDNGSLYSFVRYGLSMAEEEEEEGEAIIMSEEANPVSLMTIHAAKGLEFPMVILPDLDRTLPSRKRSGKPFRLYGSGDADTEKWNFEQGEIPAWTVEIAGMGYIKKYTPLGHLLTKRDRLEDIAENRRVFYVGCTRAKNHLILLCSAGKRFEKDEEALTSRDYREKATINELLDDIYLFSKKDPPENMNYYEGNEDSPGIVWSENEIKAFKGIEYQRDRPDSKSIGVYDKSIEKIDLSGPVKTPDYYQLSFSSVQVFLRCPVRFYYDVILGLKEKYLPRKPVLNDISFKTPAIEYEEGFEFSSKEALLLGNLMHAYMEKHDFGNSVDMDLFNLLWEGFNKTGGDLDSLREKALDQLKNISEDRELLDLMKGKKNHREVPFLCSVKKGIEFRGVIDRIFRDETTGLWSIIDWKSNSLENRTPEDVIMENNYDMQMAFYRWAVEKLLNGKAGNLYIYFSDKGRLVNVDWKGNPVNILEKIVEKVDRYKKDRLELEKDLNDIKNNGASCRYCEYQGKIC